MKYCSKCGNEMDDNAPICLKCGTPFKTKKPIIKKWWFWVLITLATIIIVGTVSEDDSSSANSGSDSQIESTEKADDNSQPKLTYEEEIATYNE
ncbi:MAG: zinc ribbon domain-containing protein, partial [Clostridia bacterium]|nr:zinc ribbon domain-containing protein [Clostridia bacterium]